MLAVTLVIGTVIIIIIAENWPIVNLNCDGAIDFLGQGSEKADLDITYKHRVTGLKIRWGSKFGM